MISADFVYDNVLSQGLHVLLKYDLAVQLLNGQGVRVDFIEAMQLFNFSAYICALAQCELGVCFERGIGVLVDVY